MKKVELLKTNLIELLDWNQARIDFLAKFMIALISSQTVNLKMIAQKFSGKAEVDSHYKRIQRFLREFPIDFTVIALLVVKLIDFGDKWILSMDRTNWKFGKININILVLGISHKGYCFPLFWVLLDKRGNSNTQERIALINRFLEVFPIERVEALTADREFVGKKWVRYLLSNRIPFRIRVRKNTQVTSARNKGMMDMYLLFRMLPIGKPMVLKNKRKVWGISLYVIGLRTKEDYVLIITNRNPHEALEDYKKRWDIETLFGCLKTRGFNFEDTSLTKHDRISKLLVPLTLSFCWCYLQGEFLEKKKPTPIKNHGRKAMSTFRRGLESLDNLLENIAYKLEAYKKSIELLSCT